MNLPEDKSHDLLLAITSLLFIIFASGLTTPERVPVNPVVVSAT